jgi:LmbE family N-acetylglucosaminyl deacetylase
MSRTIRCLLLAAAAIYAQARPVDAQSNPDRHGFAAGESRTLPLLRVAADELRIEPAAHAASWDTALLGLDVKAESSEPALELSAGAGSVTAYLDPAADGLRWVNLSGLRQALVSGAELRLRGRGARVRGERAELRTFVNPKLDKGAILIIAPHPDDAEIAAFGLYARHARQVAIATVTSGNAGDSNYAPQFGADVAGQYRFKGELRAYDSVMVPWLGGVRPERCYQLGYFDARLAQMKRTPGQALSELYGPNRDVSVYRGANLGDWPSRRPRENTWQNLVADLAALLRREQPRVVVAPHPWLDTHADHAFTTVALLEAAQRVGAKPTFLLYTNHAGGDLYPYGPADGEVSVPPWTGATFPVQRIAAYPLDAATRRRKLFALEAMHDLRLTPDEQRSCGDKLPVRPDYPRVAATDYFRRAVRTQELFYAYDFAGAAAVVQTFLEGPGRAVMGAGE